MPHALSLKPKRLGVLLVAVAITVAATPLATAWAEDPPVIKRLRTEPATLYDIGIKGLRRLAVEAADTVVGIPGSKTTVAVRYGTDEGIIRIAFSVRVHDNEPTDYTEAACFAKRRDALLATFKVGTLSYAGVVSVEERIRRRLGAQFAHEPTTDKATETVAVGERLSEMTTFEMILVGRASHKLKSCIAPVTVLTPKS